MANSILPTDSKRLQTLNNRYERLIEANQKFRYASGTKIDRYLNCLLAIKKERFEIMKAHHSTLNPEKYNFNAYFTVAGYLNTGLK